MSTKMPMRQATIQFFGRLTRDSELKYSLEGKPTLGFSVAVDRWNAKAQKREAWFANCRMFGPQCEKFAEQAKKGVAVYVTGEPYVEDWETDKGEKRRDFKVFVATADTLEWPDDGNGGQRSQQAAPPRWAAAPPRQPAPRPAQAYIPEDDIPF